VALGGGEDVRVVDRFGGIWRAGLLARVASWALGCVPRLFLCRIGRRRGPGAGQVWV